VGYVDIHSHVLYGLDDGAKTREDSVAMLETAERSGTTDIVATPHANSRYPFRPELIAARIAELGAATSVRIHPGCDFHLQFDNIEDALAHPEKYTINHKGYLLVEFPEVGVFHESEAILERLLDAGMVPIISHPERNEHLRKHPDDLARWIATGCYVQVTASSFTGLFGRASRNAAHDLLKRGLVHFVASDAHDTKYRTTSLKEAYAVLADTWGEPLIEPLFVENPRAVLAGETIDFEFPAGAPKARKWYQFFR
jgi:protein-tyrosine phosphatase